MSLWTISSVHTEFRGGMEVDTPPPRRTRAAARRKTAAALPPSRLLDLPVELLALIFGFVSWDPLQPHHAYGFLCCCRALCAALHRREAGARSMVGEMRLMWGRCKALSVVLLRATSWSNKIHTLASMRVSSSIRLMTPVYVRDPCRRVTYGQNAFMHAETIGHLIERESMPNVSTVVLPGLNIGDAMRHILMPLAKGKLKDLRELSLGANHAGKAVLPFFEELKLNALSIGDDWRRLQDLTIPFRSVCSNLVLSTLSYFNVANNGVSTAGAIKLGEALQAGALPRLNYLGVHYNPINAAGAVALLRGLMLPDVRRVWHCDRVVLTDTGLSEKDVPAIVSVFEDRMQLQKTTFWHLVAKYGSSVHDVLLDRELQLTDRLQAAATPCGTRVLIVERSGIHSVFS